MKKASIICLGIILISGVCVAAEKPELKDETDRINYSIGYQIGGAEIDVVLAIMNKRGVDRLLSNRFTLGADASIAAGPVGRTVSAQTDAMMTAEILSWSRSRGVFAGIALGGSTLRGDDDANRDLYGKKLAVREIVTGGTPVPEAARPLLDRLAKY